MKQNRLILIVDDKPSNISYLDRILKRTGYNTISTTEGQNAILLAQNEQPDLILLDIMMPEMSGTEVCKILTEDKLTHTIPIILVTALTSSEDLQRGFEAGAYDYIKKPIDKTELLARVNAALRFSDFSKLLREIEKITTFSAAIATANHELKQPLTLLNLSASAIRREIEKPDFSKEKVLNRLDIIEKATYSIIDLMDKLSAIKKPEIVDYVNDIKLVNIDGSSN